jgi:DNA-binding transcriptional LysR family regulator
MKLRHVEVFHAAMLTGTVSGAAKLLNISQPAATKVLLHAEDLLGFKLFTRSKGRIVPTIEAELLYAEASKVFAAVESLRALAKNLPLSEADVIRLAVPPAFCLDLIPKAITEMRRQAPSIRVEVNSHHYSGAIAAVLQQDVDLAIVFNPKEHPALTVDRFTTGKFVGCFPRAFGASLPTAIDLSVFTKIPFIALSSRDPIGADVMSALRLAGIDPAVSTEVNANSLAVSLVGQGAGAAIVDEYTASTAGSDVTLRAIDPPLTFEIGAVRMTNRTSSTAIAHFCRILLSCAQSRSDLYRSSDGATVSKRGPIAAHEANLQGHGL